MINYKDYEKQVYDWLIAKHNKNKNFTFSLRQKGSKGAETDYFIGTEKSNYFSTTFWYLPVAFPGSSGDCIGLQFGYTKTGYHYFFEFTQTKESHDRQNQAALALVQQMQAALQSTIGFQRQPTDKNKMFTLRTKTFKATYDTLEEMFTDIEKDMVIIFPIVDETIVSVKKEYPEFKANRLTVDEFETITQKHLERIKRFKNHNEAEVIVFEDEIVSVFEIKTQPLNQILYGPPGTGKTYNTVLEAAKIVTNNVAISYDEALVEFNKNLGNQIEFITFHQNYSYEDFIQGIRPDIDNGKELTFEKKDGVFKRIADRALFEYYIETQKVKAKAKPNEIFVDANEAYLDFFASLKVGQQFSTKTKKTIHIIKLRDNKNIVFKYESGSKPVLVSSNRLLKLYSKISNIKEIVNINDDVRAAIGGCDATIYYTVLNEFINFYEENKKRIQNEEDYQDIDYLDVTEDRKKEILSQITLDDLRSVDKNKVKNYVIIIDEINRANISRVFGELITLIEDDKRSHGKIPMRVTLPSGDTFIVPSNLYIIGTMNTADKSIALLDIALRRRFDFIPMYPLYEGLAEKLNDADKLQNINEAILSRKNHDFTIGHAYFMGEGYSLESTINKKVVPLLLEYFMNDEKEVTAILQSAGIKIGGWPLEMQS
ncbi:McrB family protein [Flavobacterium taihuense]|uniref:AAA family ATPase n=1 Tax=Flavobacterium taihuense TaxID=2857508 RepID=A0ABS6XWN9_9FLAO|nr:AAA family ATPase [Flavobacterium taihuense]MBW4361091.1 AAA family ATPase [Flavobacterium taihuense]